MATASGPAASEGQPVTLEWTAAPGCPGSDAAQLDLERLSAGRVRASDESPTRVEATLRHQPSGAQLDLTIEHDGRRERRRLDAADCETLARAAVLLIVVTVAPTDATLERPASPPPPPRDDPPPPVGPTSVARADRPPSAQPPPNRRNRLRLAAWAGPGLALAPATTLVVGGSVGLAWERFGLSLTGWHALAASREVEPGIGVEGAVTAVGIQAWIGFSAGPLFIPVRLGLDGGRLSGAGTGDRVVPNSTAAPWLAATAGTGVAWPTHSRIAVQLAADAVIPLVRPGIHLNSGSQEQEVFRTPQVAVRVLLGPVLRLF
ncbi:MAG: hypothetical protein AAF799_22685 [Myxococcota bacterium]